jgi:hypothetical protein
MSRRKSRMEDIRVAKDKRAKKMAVGGAVLLVAVLAYEIPHVMKMGHHASSPAPAATTTTPGTETTPTNPPPTGATPTALPAGNTQLPNSDVAPKRSKSQLYSFNHFAGKDPFVQQVQDPTVGSAAGVASGPSSGSSSAPGTITAAKVTKSSSVRTLATTGAVKIQVNGRIETVRVGGKFPSANPLFKLVSITNGQVKIAIANGSYASGAHAIALNQGRTVTLVDTADGIRYKIRLVTA